MAGVAAARSLALVAGAGRLEGARQPARAPAPSSAAGPTRARCGGAAACESSAGKLAIVNVFLIGIWAAAGAGYFWPAWVLLGSAIALGLKAAPWSHDWTERLQGTL